MITEATSVLELMTGSIKNNPTIYVSNESFHIFLNGEMIVRGIPDIPKSEIENLKMAKEILEKLKFGEFEIEEYQKRFDQFIRK